MVFINFSIPQLLIELIEIVNDFNNLYGVSGFEKEIRVYIEDRIKVRERKDKQLRILRHDMRLFLNTMLLYLQEGDHDNAYKLANELGRIVL